MLPFISVIIPVYNTGRYLAFCMDSLLVNQTVEKGMMEIIIVNDGSTDNSLDIILDYAERYPNITVIDQQNSGVSVARNNGMDAAKGDYIWFVDGDDFVKADCLRGIVEQLKDQPDILDIGCYRFDDSDFTENMVFNSYEANIPLWGVWSHIIKMDYLKKHNIRFVPDIAYYEDDIFKADCSEYNPTRKMSEDKAFYYYRVNRYSVTHKLNNYLKQYYSHLKVLAEMNRRLDENSHKTDSTIIMIHRQLKAIFRYAMKDVSAFSEDDIQRGEELTKEIWPKIKNKLSSHQKELFKKYKKLSSYVRDENGSAKIKKELYRISYFKHPMKAIRVRIFKKSK